MHPYLYPYVIAPVFISWNLQGFPSKTDTVIRTYCPFMLLAQNIVQICPHPLDNGWFPPCRLSHDRQVLWEAAPDVSQMPAHCVPLPLENRQVSYLSRDVSLPCQTG